MAPAELSPEEFLRRFGAGDGQALGLRLLRDAVARRDGEDVELALIVCSVFGVNMDHLDPLVRLGSADWHVKHEDVVSLLGDLKTPAASIEVMPQVLGVDDFAQRRGHRYATILVDMQPDRDADPLADWLRAHPAVRSCARTRPAPTPTGAARGAPPAIQIADRGHQMYNLSEAVHRVVTRQHPAAARRGP
jgi:hypothetical protein